MALSEIRVNTTKTRTGVGTITYTETGPVITGIATADKFSGEFEGAATITSGNITATNITATTGTFSGNVSIGGTLTYEDVTNIDAVGLVTARAGIKVTGGNINIENAAPRIDLTDTGANPDFAITNTDGNYDVTDLTNSAIRFRIASGGGVGINETSPTGKLTITQNPQGFVDDSAQPQATFLIKHGTGGTNRRWVGIGASLTGAWLQSSSPGGSGLAAPFWINKGGGDVSIGSGGTRLFVKHSGNQGVGIGTDDPLGKLHIKEGDSGLSAPGAHQDTVFIENSANAGITIATPNTNTGYLTFADPEDDNVGMIIYRHGGSKANSMGFFVNAAERVRIDSGGSVTIGDAATHEYGAHSEGDDLVIGGAGWRGMTIYGEGGGGVIQFADNGSNRIGQILYDHGNNQMDFRVNGNQTKLSVHNDKVMFSVDAKVDATNTRDLGASGAKWKDLHLHGVAHLGANGSWVKENNVRFQSGGAAYIDHATTGQDINIRTSNSSSLDTTAMFIKGDGRVQVYCLNNARGLELNVGSNAGSLVFDRNGRITSFIRASDGGSNVSGNSGGGSRVYLNKEYISWYTFPYTTNIGDAPTYTERMRLWNGGLAVGYRVGTTNVYSNQPAAFQSGRVNPDGADANVHTAQRCNLYVGSNSGWAAGDGGVLGFGGSGTGSAGQERMWAYVKGSRQSGNGWEYGGYLDLGTANWSGNTTGKKMRIWSQGQVEYYPTDSTMNSWQVGGAQRMKFTHTGGGNVSITNSNGTMTYGSTSDYRLKKDETVISNALTTIKALKPYQFTWKNDDKLGQGFFAHEAQAVLPDIGVVSGTKDAVQAEDETQNGGQWKKDDPIYQSVDYAKLVPLLTAALQELEARVASLESS